MREFKSKKPATSGNREFSFKLDDAVFTCRIKADDADFTLEYSEITQYALTADVDLMSPEGAAFVARFFRMMLGRDYARFRAHLRAQFDGEGTGSETLGEIIAAIDDWVTSDAEEETARPTKRSSSSSGGRAQPKESRVSDIAALAGGDAEILVIDPSQVHPPPKATIKTQRKARTRAG